MPEERLSISSTRLGADQVARQAFGQVRRGFDPLEVRSFLEAVAREMRVLEQREQDLRAELAAAEERARNPVLDEAKLTSALGEQTGRVLRKAHEESARLIADAEERAAAIVRDAHQSVANVAVSAESAAVERIAESEIAASALRVQAEVDAGEVIELARRQAEAMLEEIREQGRELVEEANDARRRVLGELSARRKAMVQQIEQLQAARDQMAETVTSSRAEMDAILYSLSHAEERARSAAEEVRVQPAPVEEDQEIVQLASTTSVRIIPDPRRSVRSEPAPAAPEEPPSVTPTVVSSEIDGEDVDTVDNLFARIRAAQIADGTAVHSDEPTDQLPALTVEVDVADPVELETDEHGGSLAARQRLLVPATEQLARRLKRALGDDQNRILESLRQQKGPNFEPFVSNEVDHAAGYADAARQPLHEAAAAGAAFVGGSPSAVDVASINALAADLAASVVGAIRRRVNEGAGEVTDLVGAAFREWKGDRIERLCGDAALSAFGEGVVQSAPGAPIEWVVVAGTTGCADCEDNALGGPIAAGGSFPTGHRFPPVHPGCRCLITTPA